MPLYNYIPMKIQNEKKDCQIILKSVVLIYITCYFRCETFGPFESDSRFKPCMAIQGPIKDHGLTVSAELEVTKINCLLKKSFQVKGPF